jgi:Immunoglobulin-like domain of bacterial spore germination
MNIFLWQRKLWFLAFSLLFVLAFSLAACNSNGSGTGNSTPTSTESGAASPTSPTSTLTTSTPTILMGVQPCPDAVKVPAHWDPIIPTHSPDSQVKGVRCGYLVGTPTLQALVTVDKGGSSAILDVYVYTNILATNPTQLFKLQNLIQGDAKISGYNTLLTKEVDQNSILNKGQPVAALKTDLYREFQWSDGAGTLVQTVFPGFYPDLTRYQAETDQANVNNGTDSWKLDAAQTAKYCAMSLLQMKPSNTVTVVSGGGLHDLNAVVNVALPSNGGGTAHPIKLTLSRLEGNSNGGIWIVTAFESANLSITSPKSYERLNSPVTVTGSGVAFEGQIGIVHVLDHLYNDIGHAFAMSQNTNNGFGAGTFSTPVTYNASFHGGSQEGIVALIHQGGAEFDYGVVMLKVLVGA